MSPHQSSTLKQIAFSVPANNGSSHRIILLFENSIPAHLPGLAAIDDQLVVLPKVAFRKNTRYRHAGFQFETSRQEIAGNWRLLVDGDKFEPLELNQFRQLDLVRIRNLPLGPDNEHVASEEKLRRLAHIQHISVPTSPLAPPVARRAAAIHCPTARAQAEATPPEQSPRFHIDSPSSTTARLNVIGLLVGMLLVLKQATTLLLFGRIL